MSCLVHASEAEISVLANLTVFGAVYDHGLVPCGAEFFAVGIGDCKTDGLATEPVA